MQVNAQSFISASEEENAALIFVEVIANNYIVIFINSTKNGVLRKWINIYVWKEATHDKMKNYQEEHKAATLV